MSYIPRLLIVKVPPEIVWVQFPVAGYSELMTLQRHFAKIPCVPSVMTGAMTPSSTAIAIATFTSGFLESYPLSNWHSIVDALPARATSAASRSV
jgi:hypothetical protein